MASSKAVALALLVFLALVLISVPSTSAEKEKKLKQCSKFGAHFHCGETLMKVALGKKLDKDCQGCCKYLKKVDASEAASCLCKAVPLPDKHKDEIAYTLNSILKTCKIDCKVPAYYKCPKE